MSTEVARGSLKTLNRLNRIVRMCCLRRQENLRSAIRVVVAFRKHCNLLFRLQGDDPQKVASAFGRAHGLTADITTALCQRVDRLVREQQR